MSDAHSILVTGGAGYVGSVLVPKLLDEGHRVKVMDLFIYGDDVFQNYTSHPNLELIKGDIRDEDIVRRGVADTDTVIHLACISNDPSCDLDPELTKSINFDAFLPLMKLSKDSGVGRFVFASSASVYGISDEPKVTEDHPRIPVTDYTKYKALCEDVIADEQSAKFDTVVIRPATICGYSPRLRLDLTVNILSNHAYNKGEITVFGGKQYRPNIHIDDITDLYVQLVDEPAERISGKTFNAGYQNNTVMDIATAVKGVVETEHPEKHPLSLITTPSDDVRSYRITSEKIAKELQFTPKHTIEDAVSDLCGAFSSGKITDSLVDSKYYNINTMKEIGLR